MFNVMCTSECNISRVGGVVGGWQQPLVMIYSGIPCMEPFPLDARLRFYQPVEPGKVLLQTILQGDYTIYRNDVCTVSGVDYPIKEIENWYMRPIDTHFVQLTLEAENE